MSNVLPLTKEQLYQDYIVNEMSMGKMGEKYGMSGAAIRNRLKKYSIPTRSYKGVSLKLHKEIKNKLTYEKLYQMYVVEEKSTYTIGRELNVSKQTVVNYLKQYGIKITHNQSFQRKNIDKDKLYKLYILENKTSIEIAKLFNVDKATILKYLKQYNIPVRTNIETFRLRHGSKKGIRLENQIARGLSKYRKWRKKCLARDNFTCQICGKHGGQLNVHHINNFTEFKELRYKTNNGITLCENCHQEFHRIFGQRNNTKEQLEDFKKVKNIIQGGQ